MNHDHSTESNSPNKKGMNHRLLMIACCIPMLLITLGLVFAGVISASFLIFAAICTAMMALMMSGMHGGNK